MKFTDPNSKIFCITKKITKGKTKNIIRANIDTCANVYQPAPIATPEKSRRKVKEESENLINLLPTYKYMVDLAPEITVGVNDNKVILRD